MSQFELRDASEDRTEPTHDDIEAQDEDSFDNEPWMAAQTQPPSHMKFSLLPHSVKIHYVLVILLIAFVIGIIALLTYKAFFDNPSERPDNKPIMCFGVNATDPLVCSGHGQCLSSNNCSCSSGYFGERCQIEETFAFTLRWPPAFCRPNSPCSAEQKLETALLKDFVIEKFARTNQTLFKDKCNVHLEYSDSAITSDNVLNDTMTRLWPLLSAPNEWQTAWEVDGRCIFGERTATDASPFITEYFNKAITIAALPALSNWRESLERKLNVSLEDTYETSKSASLVDVIAAITQNAGTALEPLVQCRDQYLEKVTICLDHTYKPITCPTSFSEAHAATCSETVELLVFPKPGSNDTDTPSTEMF